MSFFERVTGVIQPQKYQDALQHPGKSFDDPRLQRSRVETKDGLPKSRSGGYALVYRLTDRENNESRETVTALRCFREPKPDLVERYARISAHLNAAAASSRFFVTTRYIGNGIRIDGNWKPVTTMQWIEGQYLDVFLDHASSVPHHMGWLERQLRDLADELHRLGMAHGDLHHKNILISQQGANQFSLKLIDYDSMFVPALAKFGSPEPGHEDYQHPGREAAFGPHLDDFSLMVLYLNIVAIQRHPEVWDARTRVEGLLTREVDYLDPDGSETFARLSEYADLRRGVTAFKRICRGPFVEIPEPREFFAHFAEPKLETKVVTPPAPPDPPVDPPPTAPQPPYVPVVSPGGFRRPPRSKAISPELLWLSKREGEETAVVGRLERSLVGNGTPGSPHRTYHLETRGGATFAIFIDREVADQLVTYGRDSSAVAPGDWIWVKGLLLRDGKRFVIDLEQAADLAKVIQIDARTFTFYPELAAQMDKERRAAQWHAQRNAKPKTEEPCFSSDTSASPLPTQPSDEKGGGGQRSVGPGGGTPWTEARIRELFGMPKEEP